MNKQAYPLPEDDLVRVLNYIENRSRTPESAQAVVLFSVRAGLTPYEIAAVTPADIFDENGAIKRTLSAGTGMFRHPLRREIPWHPQLLDAVENLFAVFPDAKGVAYNRTAAGVVTYQRGIILYTWFGNLYKAACLPKYTALSGREAFAAGLYEVGGEAGITIRDIQLLLGHKSLQATAAHDHRARAIDEVVRDLGPAAR